MSKVARAKINTRAITCSEVTGGLKDADEGQVYDGLQVGGVAGISHRFEKHHC